MRLEVVVLPLALAVASPARAEPVLALRLGVAPGVGSAAGNLPMSATIPLAFPLRLDALWRTGRVAAGLYGGWGPGKAGGCMAGQSCSASTYRVGAQAAYTFPAPGLAPWAGLAFGWEWAMVNRSEAGTVTSTFSGPELAAQGGVEWSLLRFLALGPYALVGVGRYGRYGLTTPAGSASSDITDRTFHTWIELGVRARFSIGGER